MRKKSSYDKLLKLNVAFCDSRLKSTDKIVLQRLVWRLNFKTGACFPSAFAGITMGTSPIFVLLLAYIFVPDEQIGPRRIAGVILGFVGLLVLILPDVLAGQASGGTVMAKIACVAASLCYSVGAILIRRAPPIPPIAFTAGMLAAGTIALTPIALLLEGLPEVTSERATWALLYAGIIPTGLAFLLRVVLIRSAGPIFMSLVAYIVPLWARGGCPSRHRRRSVTLSWERLLGTFSA